MHVIHHAHLPHDSLHGERRLLAAGTAQGIGGFEVALRTLAPGAHTAPQRHAGELVVLALFGSGKLLLDGAPQRFSGPCTLLIPPGPGFELANDGRAPLELVWVYTRAPEPA